MYLRSFEALSSHGYHDFFERLVLIDIQVKNGIFVKIPFILFCLSFGHRDLRRARDRSSERWRLRVTALCRGTNKQYAEV
jgi:hypothetical protein